MRRRALLAVLAGALAVPASASAYYGNGATIVSADSARQEQGNDASQFAAISRDGRYVAFQTRASNFYADDDPDPPGQTRVGGIFRRDLQTGVVQRVASGDFLTDDDHQSLVARGAQHPSISADGRFVAFSSAERIVAADTNDNVDVYVRDMTRPARDPSAYTLVSARDGTADPARYATPPSGQELPGRNLGAEVTPGAALSADGHRVAFLTYAPSDLPARGTTDTPSFQVWVRDLDAHTTRLVTTSSSSGDPAGGALGPAGISGDRTSVVWTGQNASTQTFFLDGEFPNDQSFFYLWKRVADGAAAPTRRITGRADVDDSACDHGTTINPTATATGSCYGPLTIPEAGGANIGAQLPAMSDDGYRVAFLTGAGPRPNDTTGTGLDLWMTDMHPGVSRKQGSVELTREGTGDAAASSPIDGVAMSGDGRWLAVTSLRTRFALPALRFQGDGRGTPGQRELYVVDLANRTVELASRASDGGDIDGDVAPVPTISESGDAIAFTSTAANLIAGDANGSPDAFVVDRTTPRAPPPPAPRPGPSTPLPSPRPKRISIAVRSRSLGRAALELTVTVPDAGHVSVLARARPPLKPSKGRRRRTAPLQTVARARATLRRPGSVRLRLALSARTRKAFRSVRALAAEGTVIYAPAHGRPVTRRVTLRFSLTHVHGG